MKLPLPPLTAPLDELRPRQLFFNRDLSWLEFNNRVLQRAADDTAPILERARFLAIFSNNLDEFCMKRIGLLRRLIAAGRQSRSRDGMSPTAQLAACRKRIIEMQSDQADLLERAILPGLRDQRIALLRYADLDDTQRARIDEWYRFNVFPVLTPLAVDPGHRFPFISNLSKNLAVQLSARNHADRHFARVKIPTVIPNVVAVDDPTALASDLARGPFLLLEDIIASNLDDLFPGMKIHRVVPFRLTRSAAVEIEDEEVEDLLEHVEEELRMRRFADAVRMEIPPDADDEVVTFLRTQLKLADTDLYPRRGPLDYTDLFALADVDRPDLRDAPWTGITPPRLADPDRDLFSVIREGDVLVHHPYESFNSSVERFVHAAARDPDVLAIKLTIYRTSPGSPFISSLVRAAESGKQVACLVELRARFDEQRNVRFARQLEQAGVHVAYGVMGLKTHCKTMLVVRKEPDGLRTYAHLGTGNYHPKTAQLYTDLGLFTADPAITEDVVELFNALTGHSRQRDYSELIVAPRAMRQRLESLIDREIDHARAGRPARICAKMNSLEDPSMTRALYEASRAGVRVDLIVRGFCCLRPGVPGLSDNIRVTSIIGRFLEHSRFYHFANGHDTPAQGDWYIGSADLMYRNLNNRVEALVPVRDDAARKRLAHLLDVHQRDHARAWDLRPDGSYTLRTPPDDAPPDSPERLGTFITLMRETLKRAGRLI